MNDHSHTSCSSHPIPKGTRLNELYVIEGPLATGGMGEIYRARDIQTGDLVAVKMIRTDLAEREAAFALFRKEAAALRQVHHEAIVRYFVFAIDGALQRPYLAMEYIEGESLGTILSRGPLGEEATLSLMRRVASGLRAAHEKGIVHRDISPDNIIITDGNLSRARIIDFGIARSSRVGDTTIIGSGFAGKFNYVSPEQLGLFGGEVTAKSDIYSLGLVVAHCLRGRPLEMGGTQAAVVEKRRGVPDLSDVGDGFRPLLSSMLQPDPAHRPASIQEIEKWLIPLNRTRALRETPLTEQETSPRGAALSRSWRGMALVIGGVCGVAIGGSTYWYWLRDARRDPIEFVRTFDGGSCFTVTPSEVTEHKMKIEGYGNELQPFERLDDAFKKAFGFEAEIDFRQVTESQCPAATFLGSLRQRGAEPPRIELAQLRVPSGDELAGQVAQKSAHLALLLVSEEGLVRNVTGGLTPGGPSRPFRFPVWRTLPTPGQPQLLIAVDSSRPLTSLAFRGSKAGELVFPATLAEASRSGEALTATLAYFKVD